MAKFSLEKTKTPGIYRVLRDGEPTGAYKVFYRASEGVQRTKTFQPPDAQRKAKAFKDKGNVSREEGTLTDPRLGRVTLAEFFDHVMDISTNLRPTTRNLYEMQGRNYIKSGSLGNRRLASIGVSDINLFQAEQQKAGKGDASVNSVRRLLHKIFEVALREGRVQKNPVHYAEPAPAAEHREPRFLSAAEVARISAEAPPRYRALVTFLAYTRLRIGEATALRMRSVDLAEGEVRVVESSPEVSGHKIPGGTKTRRQRRVPLGPNLLAVLKDHLAEFGTPLDRESYVFTAENGTQVRQGNFRSRIFQPAAARAGITPVPTVHDLRHTAASLMAQANLSMREAQDILGHTRTAMTDQYTHLRWSDTRENVRPLDDLIVTPQKS